MQRRKMAYLCVRACVCVCMGEGGRRNRSTVGRTASSGKQHLLLLSSSAVDINYSYSAARAALTFVQTYFYSLRSCLPAQWGCNALSNLVLGSLRIGNRDALSTRLSFYFIPRWEEIMEFFNIAKK